MTGEQQFESWFMQATGHAPYPFQVRFACDRLSQQPSPRVPVAPLVATGDGEGGGEGVLVDIPTGLGKTAMAVLGWLWRRRFHPDEATKKVVAQ